MTPRLVRIAPLVLALACSASSRPQDGPSGGALSAGPDGVTGTTFADGADSDDGAATTGDDGNAPEDAGGGVPKLDVGADPEGGGGGGGAGGCNGTAPPASNATLTGTVYAPNREIPISGALVYLTTGEPEPVPDGVYCAQCVEIPCDAYSVLTEPDGSFELPAIAGAGKKLVVQKGQFLHVTPIDVVEGNNPIGAEESSLPGRWAPEEGEWIPRIAIANSFTDEIHDVLAKLGLGQVDTTGELIDGTEQFDILDGPDSSEFLNDIERMNQYHIIFVPCQPQNFGVAGSSQSERIQEWVAAGGKWYVTDWANDFIDRPFPDYQTFHAETPGNIDLSRYDTTAAVTDPDLLAWLQALPPSLKDIGGGNPTLYDLPQIDVRDNWSGIDETPNVTAMNMEGEEVDVGHHAWVTGPCHACDPVGTDRPMTVSAQYGCGRMMFSTYHTEEAVHSGLSPQELVLLYIILEIGICHDEPPPLPPEG